MDVNNEIRSLARALDLKDEPQDWGIANADPSRVDEFIRFRETSGLTLPQQYALVELVIASMNDALEEHVADAHVLDGFEQFLASGLHGLPEQIRYWSALDEDECPVATLLQRLNAHV